MSGILNLVAGTVIGGLVVTGDAAATAHNIQRAMRGSGMSESFERIVGNPEVENPRESSGL